MELLSISAVDAYLYQVMLINLVIAVALLSGLRFVTGLVANVNSAEELATRDNFAFGVAMAGGIVALALMLTGAVSGEASESYVTEIIAVLGYGVLGVILIKVGRLVQDRVVLRGIAIQAEIRGGNLAAALVDVANTIATGLVLRAVMMWVESDALTGLLSVLAAFVFTQFILAAVSKYRVMVYASRHDGSSLESAFAAGKVPLAIRFLGHLLGVALAVTAASGVVAYLHDNLVVALLLWAGVTLLFTVAVSLLTALARSVVLMGVNVVEEVDHQDNIGVAAIEASIAVAVGLLLVALFA